MAQSKTFRYAKILAEAFVQTIPIGSEEELVKAASKTFFDGKKPRWLRPVAREIEEVFSESRSRPLLDDVAQVITRCPSFTKAVRKGTVQLSRPCQFEIRMAPGLGRPQQWQLPQAANVAELAKVIELHLDDLHWLTQAGLARSDCETKHYYLKWHRKKHNSSQRLIEVPKPLLKETQRVILTKLLKPIPPHEAACGFCEGKSVIDFVSPHCGKALVLKMDFKDYFPSIRSGRILGLFMAAGYPETVAKILTTLCTNQVNERVLIDREKDFSTRAFYTRPHLPQGAPTSPTLANLVTYRLDCRLAGLARAAGINYTRYADDLLFSGGKEFTYQANRFYQTVLSIVIKEGFRIHTRKTRFMKAAQRQQAAGLILNEKPNLDRREYDRLKAILTNCLNHGPQSQNLDNHPEFCSHLRGKLLWLQLSNPNRANKLWSIFEQINWEEKR